MTVHTKIAPGAADAAAAAPLPMWSLSDLYSGRDDPRIETDLQAGAAAVAELVRLKGAFVGARGNAPRLGLLLDQGIATYEKATNLILATGAYAGLAASTARDDPAWAKFESDLQRPPRGDRRRQPVPDLGAEPAGGMGDRERLQGASGGRPLASRGYAACA